MNFLSKIRTALFGEQPPKLRNRVDGVAIVNSSICDGGDDGSSVLVNCVVRTSRVRRAPDVWEIDPPLPYTVTRPTHYLIVNEHASVGEQRIVIGLRDHCLTPLRDPGYDERDESLSWAPAPPKVIPLKVRGEVH